MTYLSEVIADSPLVLWPMTLSPGQNTMVSLVNGYTNHTVSGVHQQSMGYSGPDSEMGSFSGADERWRCYGPFVISGAMSVEMWWYHGEWTGALGPPKDVEVGFATGGGFLGSIQLYRGSGNTIPQTNVTAVVPVAMASPTAAEVDVPLRRWHHAVLVDDSTTVALFIDGVNMWSVLSSGASSGGIGFDIYAAEGLFVGPCAGYNQALTPTRIAAHYLAADRVATPPFPVGIDNLQKILNSVYRVYPLST